MLGQCTRGIGLPASLALLLGALVAWNPIAVGAADGDLGSVLGATANLSTYYDLIKAYPDILLQLPNYAGVTVIAPNNEAFTKVGGLDPKNTSMVTNILQYHILRGTVSMGGVAEGVASFFPSLLTDPKYANVSGGQNIIVNKQPGNVVILTSGLGSRCTVLQQDITFSGGLIQVVDSLMVEPARIEHTTLDAYKDLTAFMAALYAADLASVVADTANVTIFAPRNAAFQLLSGTLSGLSKQDLAAVLRYHIVPGAVIPSVDFKNGTNLTTWSAGTFAPTKLSVTRDGNNLWINSAQVIQPDILIANGVVHMIDAVLNPNAATLKPDPALGTQTPAFTLSGSTATGTDVPVPYTTYIPSPVSTTSSATSSSATNILSSTTTGGARSSSSKGAAAPRCTGAPLMAGVGAGLLGLGLGVAGIV